MGGDAGRGTAAGAEEERRDGIGEPRAEGPGGGHGVGDHRVEDGAFGLRREGALDPAYDCFDWQVMEPVGQETRRGGGGVPGRGAISANPGVSSRRQWWAGQRSCGAPRVAPHRECRFVRRLRARCSNSYPHPNDLALAPPRWRNRSGHVAEPSRCGRNRAGAPSSPAASFVAMAGPRPHRAGEPGDGSSSGGGSTDGAGGDTPSALTRMGPGLPSPGAPGRPSALSVASPPGPPAV